MTTLKLSGGAKLEKYLMELAVKVQKPATLNVGFLEGANYDDGTPVAAAAAYNEFGTATIPPRPFFRGMIERKKGNWGKTLGDLLISNKYDAPKALDLMGDGIKGQLQESIQELTSPPLAKSTILARAKGAKRGEITSPTIAKPLIDTGHMLDSVDYEVKS